MCRRFLFEWAIVVVFRPPAEKQLNCQLASQLFPIKDASETEQIISKLKYAESTDEQMKLKLDLVLKSTPSHGGTFLKAPFRSAM
jgi:hypothetical protein